MKTLFLLRRTSTSLLLVGLAALLVLGCSGDPNVEGAKLNLKNKQYADALDNLNKALETNPQNGEVYMLMGQVYKEMAAEESNAQTHVDLVQKMAESYDQALMLMPDKAQNVELAKTEVWYNEFNRGQQAFNQGSEDQARYADAAAYFGSASMLQPDSSSTYINEGYAWIAAGQMSKAITPLEMAIQKGDNSVDTYIYLAELYLTENRIDDGIALLEQAREQYPTEERVSSTLVNAYIAGNKTNEAIAFYRNAVATDPGNGLYQYNYGTLLLGIDQYDDAIKHLEIAAELRPDDAGTLFNLGTAYNNKVAYLQGQMNNDNADEVAAHNEEKRALYTAAIPHLERARQLNDTNGDSNRQVCQALFFAYANTNQVSKAEDAENCVNAN